MAAFPRNHFRRRRALAGFTLIELLIVIIIVGILMAIGIPAYLSYQAKAKDTDAKSALLVAYKAAVAGDSEVNNGRFPVASTIVQDVQADEPGASVARGSCLAGIGGASTKQVLVDPASTTSQLIMCIPSASGAIWKLSGQLTGTPTITDASTIALTFNGNEITDATRAAAAQGDGLANDSSTGFWDTTTNLAKNGGFETGTGVWTTTGPGVTWGRDTSSSKFGAASAHMTVVAANPTSGLITGNGGTIPVSPSTTYTMSAWIAGSGDLMLRASQFTAGDGSGSFLGDLTGAKISATAGWARYSFTFTSGATTNGVALQVIQHNDGVADDVHIDAVQLEQKAYASPYVETNGATATRGQGRVQASAGVLTETQGWVAMRVRLDYANTQGPIGLPLFAWSSVDGHNRLSILSEANQTGSVKGVDNTRNSVGNSDSIVQTWNAGDVETIIGYWTNTQLGFSWNGGTFTTVGRSAAGGTALQSTINIGTSEFGNAPGEDVLWFACGVGTLSNADAAMINSWGSSDPKRASFPSSAQATAVWDGVSSTASLK